MQYESWVSAQVAENHTTTGVFLMIGSFLGALASSGTWWTLSSPGTWFQEPPSVNVGVGSWTHIILLEFLLLMMFSVVAVVTSFNPRPVFCLLLSSALVIEVVIASCVSESSASNLFGRVIQGSYNVGPGIGLLGSTLAVVIVLATSITAVVQSSSDKSIAQYRASRR